MTDIRQSPFYARYIQSIGWKVERIGKWYAFIRQFPLLGSFIKIQRIKPPIPFAEIEQLAKKYRAFRVVVELDWRKETRSRRQEYQNTLGLTGGKTHREWQTGGELTPVLVPPGWTRCDSPYSPSKTIHIDLIPKEEEIFQQFTDAKRRAVRRAQKNNIIVKESADINQLIKLKQKQDLLFGFLLRKDLKALWHTFWPKSAVLLLAYWRPHSNLHLIGEGIFLSQKIFPLLTGEGQGEVNKEKISSNLIAGVLLLFWDRIAYYWQAAATKEGKKLFAPTLLVWEGLKLAKRKRCKIFDFEGIYDERFPQATKNWQGFTKFKEGFGGKIVIHPKPRVKSFFPYLHLSTSCI